MVNVVAEDLKVLPTGTVGSTKGQRSFCTILIFARNFASMRSFSYITSNGCFHTLLCWMVVIREGVAQFLPVLGI